MKKIFAVFALLAVLGAGSVLAETHTEFVTGNPVTDPQHDWDVYVIKNTLNFADLDTPGPYGTGILAGVTRDPTNEIVQLLDIPAGTLVKAVHLRIKSPWGTATAADTGNSGTGVTMTGVDIGDGADADGWITAMDWGPSASGVSTTQEEGVAGVYHTTYGGKYYSAADTIDACLPLYSHRPADFSGLTDFELQVVAECVDLNNTANNYGTTE